MWRAEDAQRSLKEWKDANGMEDEKVNRFFSGLDAQGQAKIQEEEEAFAKQMEMDLEHALHAVQPASRPTHAPRRGGNRFV